MEAGFAYNVIPSEVLIEGTIRALEEDVRQELDRRIGEIARATAETFRGEAEYEMIWGAPPVINDADMAALAAECARDVEGDRGITIGGVAGRVVRKEEGYRTLVIDEEKNVTMKIVLYAVNQKIKGLQSP